MQLNILKADVRRVLTRNTHMTHDVCSQIYKNQYDTIVRLQIIPNCKWFDQQRHIPNIVISSYKGYKSYKGTSHKNNT
jgi:hypothetical protein